MFELAHTWAPLPGTRPVTRLGLFATAPAPLSPLLVREIEALGGRRARARGAGVEFDGDLAVAYRVCLWSRLASRVLMPLARLPASDGEALYGAARELPWEDHLAADATFAVDCTVRRARIGHSHFAALRLKDAIADRFRARTGRRPDVDVRGAGIRVHLHLRGDEGRVALDLSGGGLHRRGYRAHAGPAPLRETLAAAVLAAAGWPDPRAFDAFLDPVCGSGTLLVEAALMAADAAPGLTRDRFGFESWGGHDPALWQALWEEAQARRARGLERLPRLVGGDRDRSAVATTEANLQRAGLAGRVRVEVREIERQPPADLPAERGLLAANPPYGGRLDDADARHCRTALRALAEGALHAWSLALLLPDDGGWPASADAPGLAVRNGALPCRVHVLAPGRAPGPCVPAVDAAPLANRIARNERRLAPWRRREDVDCYRVYDADLPEFAFAVDVYTADGRRHGHVQEYAPPPQVDSAQAQARREAALAALPAALDVAPDGLVVKTRERQRGARQYLRQARREEYLEVREHGARLLVNLRDHLDTGLFLDHRPARRWIRDHAAGARFLNLFAYTGAATVHAAAGGARESVSVDLSAAYLDWAARNLALNGFGPPRHRLVRADCMDWLAGAGRGAGRFDLVFVDPPTFSNSKRMRGSFDVQRDHAALLGAAMGLLAPGGTLLFSSNRRGFRLDTGALDGVVVEDWTVPSIPPDFSRPARPHRCWKLRHARPPGAA